MTLTVQTSAGKVRGTACNGGLVFRGIPYAAGASGVHRFLPPQPVAWTGVRNALEGPPRCPQRDTTPDTPWHGWLRDPAPMHEDCLALNLYTTSLDASARRPVMVYLHGGGFVMGGCGAPGLDGSRLAQRGAVVVTVQHRLNLFGFLHLGSADGGRYADAANVGLLDLVAALQWVRENIERFGGDPGNVTVFGQSGGGSKVAALMAMPSARGLFHKAVVQSASSLRRFATLEEAERNTHHFLRALGLAPNRLGDLLERPAPTLLAALDAAIQAAGQIDNFRPVVDGRVLPWQPDDPAALRLSADVPLLTGWCENEQRLAYSATPRLYAIGADDALSRTADALQVDAQRAAPLFDAYRNSRPLDTPGDLHAQIQGDHRYRRNVTAYADAKAATGGAQVYLYLLAWKTPVHQGLLRTPHTLCLPFVFANAERASGITGTGAECDELERAMADAWVAYARSGNPNHAGLPNWRRHDTERRPTLVFDRSSREVEDPLRDERLALEPFPHYVPAVGEGRRTW